MRTEMNVFHLHFVPYLHPMNTIPEISRHHDCMDCPVAKYEFYGALIFRSDTMNEMSARLWESVAVVFVEMMKVGVCRIYVDD